MDDYKACEKLVYNVAGRLQRMEERTNETIRTLDTRLETLNRLMQETEMIKISLGVYGRIQ